MKDTPIELLKLVLAEVEECVCDVTKTITGIQDRCLHCRIKAVVDQHEREIAERDKYWRQIQTLQRQLSNANAVANEYRQRLEEARLI